MCSTNDPFITYLKQFGYSPIRLPRTNIRPLQVLAKSSGDLTWLGDITELFRSPADVPIPALSLDVAAAEISGKRSGKLSAGIGLSILGGIIEALAGSKLGITAGFSRESTIAFEFPAVQTDLISTIALDKFLGASDVDPAAVAVGKLLEADQLYVITSTVKASTFVVQAEAASGGSVAVDVPIIKHAVGGHVKVEADSSNANKVSFTGAVPVIFGFQAVQLFYDKGRYTAIKPLTPGRVAARSIDATASDIDDRLERYEAEGTFARIRL